MTSMIKYIGLILGLLSTIVSFLFFGRQQGTYQLLLIGGLLVSIIFFITIWFSKGRTQSKLIWTLVVVFAIAIQWLTEPLLINGSYLIFLNSNNNELIAVNNILCNKPGEIFILNDAVKDNDSVLSQADKDILVKLRQQLNVYIISKSDNGIYYGLWGFLDVRLGITYWTKVEKPTNEYQHLKDNWYY